MKKVSSVILVFLLIISLSGCKSNVKLEEGQTYTVLDSDGGMSMSVFLSDKELDGSYGVDFDDDEDEIEESIIELFDDSYGMDVEITKFKKGKDNVSFTMTSEDAEDYGYDLEYTLEEFAEDSYYEDIDELAETESFIVYKDEKDLDEDELKNYEDAIVIYVGASDEGSYYKFPSKILLVDENLDYNKVSSDTIFIEDNGFGMVIIEQ